VARVHGGEGDLQLAEIRARQSALELARGDARAAEQLARSALPILERALDPEHQEIALARHGLGRALLEQGNAQDAEPELRMAAERYEAAFTLNDVRTLEFRYAWGEALAVLNDVRAEAVLRASAERLTQDSRYQGAVRGRAIVWLTAHPSARLASAQTR
jgi:tetratricopeptide (TPR) repeat protein